MALSAAADKGHSPFPSSKRAVCGFALWLASFLALGEPILAPRIGFCRPTDLIYNLAGLFLVSGIICRCVFDVGVLAGHVVGSHWILLSPSQVSSQPVSCNAAST